MSRYFDYIYIFRIISTIEGYSLLGHNETNNADNEYSVSSNAWILIIFIFVFVMELSSDYSSIKY